MAFSFDKSQLSESLAARQREKGTYDSPCMSICDYNPTSTICETCKMKKLEKKAWKAADSNEKEVLANIIIKRSEQTD